MDSPTATITFDCLPNGRVVRDLWHDPDARDAGTRNAVAIERLVRLAMSAPECIRARLESALDDAETFNQEDKARTSFVPSVAKPERETAEDGHDSLERQAPFPHASPTPWRTNEYATIMDADGKAIFTPRIPSNGRTMKDNAALVVEAVNEYTRPAAGSRQGNTRKEAGSAQGREDRGKTHTEARPILFGIQPQVYHHNPHGDPIPAEREGKGGAE